MAQKKGSSKSSKSRTSAKNSKRKSNIKKGKVYIPAYKVISLCIGVIAVCVLLLLAATLVKPKSSNAKATENQTITQRYQSSEAKQTKSPEVTAKKSAEKTENKTASKTTKTAQKPAQTKSTEQKAEAPKTAQKPVEIKKTEPVKQPEKTSAKQETKPEVKKSEPKVQPVPQNTAAATAKSDMDFPAAVNNAQLIFVFDDGGQNLSQIDKFTSQLKFPYTVAVLPRLPHSAETASRVRNSGNEVILHQPMQAVNTKVNPGAGAITPDMNEDQIISTLFQNVQEISPISGMNNHEGSLITADAEKMAVVMKFASESGLYFLDSRTNVETKVPYVAHALGYNYYERNIFLDNEKTRENIVKELKKGLDIANKKGFVIMIGHVWSADLLPSVLAEAYPELVKKGYTFSTVSKSKAEL